MLTLRFNAWPRAASRRPTRPQAARPSDTDRRQREFQRLVGSIIVIAEEGRPVTIDELVGKYAFTAPFLLSHKANAAERVAAMRPDLAGAVGHMQRVS